MERTNTEIDLKKPIKETAKDAYYTMNQTAQDNFNMQIMNAGPSWGRPQ